MNVISENPRIIDLDGYAHLVKDKFICFGQGLFDLSDPEDRAFLLEYADALYGKNDEPRHFGHDTVCVLSACPDGGYYTGQCHAHALPESSCRMIEEVRHEFGL